MSSLLSWCKLKHSNKRSRFEKDRRKVRSFRNDGNKSKLGVYLEGRLKSENATNNSLLKFPTCHPKAINL